MCKTLVNFKFSRFRKARDKANAFYMYAPALLVRGRRAEPLVNCYILFIGKQNKYLLINKYIKNTRVGRADRIISSKCNSISPEISVISCFPRPMQTRNQ